MFVEKGKALDHAKRHAAPVVLAIDTSLAIRLGVLFRQSNDSVWVADHVPACCLVACESSREEADP